MSGLYLLGVIALWLWLTWFLVRLGWRVRARKMSIALNTLMVCIILAWFGFSFWYGGGRKFYYDWQVERMCAVDGGVRVYETVELPEDKYEQYAKKNWILPDSSQVSLSDMYYVKTNTNYYRQGTLNMSRKQHQIIRRRDGKVLGESIRYGRSGGDLPGPWHHSSFKCPDPVSQPANFETAIFVRGEIQ